MSKQFKIIILAATCFGSRRNHHQGAVLCLAKTTKLFFCARRYRRSHCYCGTTDHNVDCVYTDEHRKTIFVVLVKNRTAPWWWFLREPKHVGASIVIFILSYHFYDFIIVYINWNNKKCFWYYWCTVQTWRSSLLKLFTIKKSIENDKTNSLDLSRRGDIM